MRMAAVSVGCAGRDGCCAMQVYTCRSSLARTNRLSTERVAVSRPLEPRPLFMYTWYWSAAERGGAGGEGQCGEFEVYCSGC